MKERMLFLMLVLCISTADAIETTELSLRDGASADGMVTVTRDGEGNLVLRDVHTNPVTLSTLMAAPQTHGALDGLSADDHPHYLNTARHASSHGGAFNDTLAISPDVNGNATLGAHAADSRIHLDLESHETIAGIWTFTNSVGAYAGGVVMGEGQFAARPAIRFADSPDDAEFGYDAATKVLELNRELSAPQLRASNTISGSGTATLEGFASIEGIAADDLLSSTKQESISAPWMFLDDVSISGEMSAEVIHVKGLPAFTMEAVNFGPDAIVPGQPVRFVGLTATGELAVASCSSEIGSATAFAGVALTTASQDEAVRIVHKGVTTMPATDSFSAGESVGWNGSALFPGGYPIAYALEHHSSAGTVKVWIGM